VRRDNARIRRCSRAVCALLNFNRRIDRLRRFDQWPEFAAADFTALDIQRPQSIAFTELKFKPVRNCPLSTAEYAHCPAALHMAPAVESLKALVSSSTWWA